MSNLNTALTPTNGEPMRLPAMTDAGEAPTGIFSTFADPYDTLDAMGDGQEVTEVLGQTLHWRNIVTHPVQFEAKDGSGEMEGTRVILCCDEGNFAMVSKGAEMSLTNIMTLLGKPPYDPALRIKIVSKKTPKGNTYNIIPLRPGA